MNKKILVLILLAVCLTVLCACETPTNDDQYAKISQMMQGDYSKIQVDISVVKSGDTQGLTSKVVFNYLTDGSTKVLYSLQSYAKFDVENNVIPDEQIVTTSGSVVVANGQITNTTGSAVDVDWTKLSSTKLAFDKTNVTNATLRQGLLQCDLVSIQALLGVDIQGCTNAKLSVDMSKLNGFVVSYSIDNSDVTLTYTLTK